MAQVRVQLRQAIGLGKNHVMYLYACTRVATAKHHDVKHDQSYRAANNALV